MKNAAIVFLSFAFLLIVTGGSWADAVEDRIAQALAFYKAGSISQAVKALEQVSAQLQKQKADQLLKLFPAPLPDWTADEAIGESLPYSILGGGITAGRMYRHEKSGRTVQIEIINNETLVQGILALLNNPFLASHTGAEMTQIKNYQAVQEFRAEDQVGKISVVVQGKMLIELEGERLDGNEILMQYAGNMDYAALEKFLSQ